MEKKKILGFISMVLSLSILYGCSVDSGTASVKDSDSESVSIESDSTVEEPEELETISLNVVDNLKGKTGKRAFRTEGRTFYRNGVLACDLSCTGVRFNACCKGEVSAKFTTSAECYFTIYINGERQRDRICARPADSDFIKIAEFDEYGEYEIRIVKQSQYPMAYSGISDVRLTGSFGTRPAEKERFIEFYGDSMMNGSNIYKGGTSAATSDATLAFGYLTALALNADCNIIGRGGMALNRNGNTDGLLEIWDLCGGVSSPQVSPYGFDRVPDCVVVEIGDNDYRVNHVPGKYTQGVRDMVLNLRSAYGNDVKIVWCHSYTDVAAELWTSVTKDILDQLNADGNILYCPIPISSCPKSEGGDGLHPDVDGAANMASTLTSFINENIYS